MTDVLREQWRPITKDSSLPNNQIFGTAIRLPDFSIDTDTVWIQTKLTAVMESKYTC